MQQPTFRTARERLIHAIGYEVILTLIGTPVIAWALQRPLTHTGALSIMLTAIAMLWNMFYNAAFDRRWPSTRVPRSLAVRTLHALGFETGLTVVCLPLAMLVLQISIWQALAVEAGWLVFILPYTMTYNWAFDWLRPVQAGRAGI